ncbi:MAG: gliding motility-associated ABC transporter substrate-binding protein GldG [Bacteroidales bacterium]|nr:gliding motility-associated ABC transporter substrate-binding protein GldG [Bacteroidales bacterium]
MQSNRQKLRSQQLLTAFLIIFSIILFNIISQNVFFRLDLTSEKRYTISEQTKLILSNLDDVVFIRIYLDGDLNIELNRFRKNIAELLDEFKVYAGNRLEYEFADPFDGADAKTIDRILEELYNKGLAPVNIHQRKKDGSITEKVIVPGAIINYNDSEISLNLLMNNPGKTGAENLNNSVELLEYNLISTIKNLTNNEITKIAFLEGHGEWPDPFIGDLLKELSKSFQIDRGKLNNKADVLEPYKAVVIAGSINAFSEADKFIIDQYIMRGGKVLWLIDGVNIDFDSLATGYSFALPNNLNLDDMLFRYGVRINQNLVQDAQCGILPVNVALAGNAPNFQPAPWLYFPLVSHLGNHAITQNINLVQMRFASSIDTLGARSAVRKTPLLSSSSYTKLREVPALIELREINQQPAEADFRHSSLILGVLLEGTFESVFKNRLVENLGVENLSKKFDISPETKMIVIADADIVRNDIKHTSKGPVISPLGFDKFTNQTYGNKDFLNNAISYLADENHLLALRGREFKLRMLDKTEISKNRLKWQLINILIPAAFVLAGGIAFSLTRKFKYSR